MTTPTHLSIGYLVAQRILATSPLPTDVKQMVITISMLSSVLPDLDALIIRKALRHRDSILHAPFFWTVLLYPAFWVFTKTGHEQLATYTVIVAVNILLHLFADTFGLNQGIRWFWPFNQKEVNFLKLQPAESMAMLAARVIKHPLTYIEMIIWGIALFIRFRYGLR